MKNFEEYIKDLQDKAKIALPLCDSIRSIIWNPPFIKYLPYKQKELKKAMWDWTPRWLYTWDNPTIQICIHHTDPEWVVENILYPLRQKIWLLLYNEY